MEKLFDHLIDGRIINMYLEADEKDKGIIDRLHPELRIKELGEAAMVANFKSGATFKRNGEDVRIVLIDRAGNILDGMGQPVSVTNPRNYR